MNLMIFHWILISFRASMICHEFFKHTFKIRSSFFFIMIVRIKLLSPTRIFCGIEITIVLVMISSTRITIYLWNRYNNLHDAESEDWTSFSKIEAIVLSCNNFLLLSARFLLKVASISKSKGTKLPVGDLWIQNTDRNNSYPIQEENNYKQNKYSLVIKE